MDLKQYQYLIVSTQFLPFCRRIQVYQAEVSELLEEELSTTVVAKLAAENCSMRQHEDFCGEVNLLARCEHVNIVRLMGVCLTSVPQMFCVEFMEFGNLHSFLQEAAACVARSRTGGLDDADVIDLDMVGAGGEMLSAADLTQIARQIASGMVYLSRIGFVHKDLAARSCQVGWLETDLEKGLDRQFA